MSDKDCFENFKNVMKIIDSEKDKILIEMKGCNRTENISFTSDKVRKIILESQLLMCERLKQTIANTWG